MKTAPRLAGLLTVAALVVPPVATAQAAPGGDKPAPCAQQEKQVEKAEEALARVTAVLERRQAKVTKAKRAVHAAERGSEKAQARKALTRAQERRDDTAKVRKAQQQRVARAEARLAACEADQTATGA